MTRNKIGFFAALTVLLSLWLTSSVSASDSEPKTITVVFRFDDCSSISGTDFYVKMIDALQTYNLSCTIGVVPCLSDKDILDPSPQGVILLSPEKAGILKDTMDTTVEVALHGYSHQTRRASSEGGYTEFAGLDYDGQRQKIVEGKKLLEDMLDTKITTFTPPWNSYDSTTVQVLEELNFTTISADLNGPAVDPSRLNFLPSTGGIPELQNAIREARKSRDSHPIIITLFYADDFREIDTKRGFVTFQEFDEILKWVASQPDVRTLTIDDTVELITGLDSHLYKSYQEILSPPNVLSPPFITNELLYYPSLDTVGNMKFNTWLIPVLFYFTLLVISVVVTFFIGLFVFRRFGFLHLFGRYGSLLVLLLYSVYTWYDLIIGFRGATVLAVILGICGGIWLSSYRVAKTGRSKQVTQSAA